MSDIPLFMVDEETVVASDFTNALRAVGATHNDTVFVHADIGVFGKLAPRTDRQSLCRNITTALEDSVATGTLIMPTFTYAFCKDGVYDADESGSEVGILTEFFRRKAGVTRSRHPIFSVAASGPNAASITDVNFDSFGQQSFFANLHRENGLIVLLGASFERATFAHYIEQSHGVPYRFVKTFKGRMRDGSLETPIECTYLVRYLDQVVETYLARLEQALKREALLKEATVGSGKILAVRADDMFKMGMRMLDDDIFAFLKQPPKKIT